MTKKELHKIIDKIVEARLSKIVPMLVEHEVNRMLREATTTSNVNSTVKPTDTKNTTSKSELREHFSKLIGGSVDYDEEGTKTLSFNSQNTFPNNPTVVQGLENKPINTADPNVSKVMNIINRDYSKTMKAINAKKNNRGFMPE